MRAKPELEAFVGKCCSPREEPRQRLLQWEMIPHTEWDGASHRLTVRQMGIALGGGFEYVGGGAWRPHQTQAQPPTPKANNRRTRTPATEAAVLVVRLTAHSVAKQAADD